jgi:hypothetical protein
MIKLQFMKYLNYYSIFDFKPNLVFLGRNLLYRIGSQQGVGRERKNFAQAVFLRFENVKLLDDP